MTQDQTVTNGAQSDHSPGGENNSPPEEDGREGMLRTAEGTQVPVPADLPDRAERYRRAVTLADSLIGALQGLSLDGLAELEDLTRLAHGADPYAPGGSGYASHLKVSGLRAFVSILRAGEARDRDARHHREQAERRAGEPR